MPKKKISNNTKKKESISYTNEMPVHRPSIKIDHQIKQKRSKINKIRLTPRK